MKTIKLLLTASAAAVALTGSVFAQNNTATIDITGSTAFRSSAHAAILARLFNETYAFTGSTASSADQAIYTGNLGSTTGPVVTVRTNWSGSAEGIEDLDQNVNQAFLATGGTQSTNGTASRPIGTDPALPDLAFSDVFQSSTAYTSKNLQDNIVAIVPFQFVVSAGGAAAGVTNMTPQIFNALWTNGTAALALLTGNPNDEGTTTVATGRNNGSGTRITIFAETGFGIGSSTVQYDFSTGSPTPFASTGGYGSGGTVATLMGTPFSSYGVYILSYLGIADATAAATAGGSRLTYNGVAYSAAAVYNGTYTLWGYEHLFALPGASGNISTLVSQLASEINANPGAAGLNSSLMRVSRGEDGGTVAPLY